MRKLSFIALMLLSVPTIAQLDTVHFFRNENESVSYFGSLGIKSFIDKPVKSFLQVLPPGVYEREILDSDKDAYAGMLRISYPYGLMVDLYITAFEYTNPNGISRRKKFKAIEKETVAAIRIHNGLACIKGCD
ncbi:MAG: hypothetical protein M3342_19850 [Bacteroidota bacterium]|nr:hypothetical protein [Flavisolibacter sp.]MBD0366425.1 hypothetical protein [Flavisolibacter sp.]MBD0376163.1 hypothetical protein [Flavisolibacter sp.]MDQ3846239.1 hypothetical protein [Bacteroidota bacterium]